MNINKKYGLAELTEDFGILTFGNALLSYRLGEELTQKEFAKLLSISSQSLCDIEKERRVPSPKRAEKIAKQLNEPIAFWVQLALQDMLRVEKINLSISVA